MVVVLKSQNSPIKMRRNIRMFEKIEEKFDKRNVYCYNCNKFGHFASDYWSNKESKGEKANIARGYFEDELVLLIVYESEVEKMVNWWYMDTDFSNHLTENKKWLVDFDYGRNTKIG